MVGKKIEVAVSRKALSIDKEKKTVTFVMSTQTVDRHGDIVDQNSWMLDHFMSNPAFFLQHDADEFPIGKWLTETVKLEADPDNLGHMRLIGTAEFRTKYEDAARAFDHVVEGDLNMVSVGFIPHRIDYDETKDAFVLYDCELLECSLVGIGSNRGALAKRDEENHLQDAKDSMIDAKDAIDKYSKANNNNLVISHLKAREDLNKAIRRMGK